MFDLFKSRAKESSEAAEEERRIAEARKYLEDTHRDSYSKDEFDIAKTTFHYIETVKHGTFKRYHFYRGFDERMVYVVLSNREKKIVMDAFKSKAGKGYAYQDSIITKGNGMQHRFYRPNCRNTSITFMDDETGKVWGGNYDMDC